jgi:uncharacterized YccA/Bax inhibitor family protein
MNSSNPTLNDRILEGLGVYDIEDRMTVQGTATKTILLLLMAMTSAVFAWGQLFSNGFENAGMYTWGGAIGGFIFAMITIFKKEWAGYTAPVYAILEGLFLGGISAMYSTLYEGIVLQAVGLTFGVFFTMLLGYRSGLIKVTERFRAIVIAATGGVALFYVVAIILGFFGISIPMLHDSSPLGIGLSLAIIVIAALNLALDFDFIEKASKSGAPKYFEWYGAFGLMVTLVWLYLEILRLLSRLNSRN